MNPEAFRVSEFCELYKISKTTFYKEIKGQRLNILKCGRRTLIARIEAERWFEALGQQQNI